MNRPSASVEVLPIALRDRRAKETFIRFPWQIYPHGSPWCPPLLSERRRFLDPARNPFFANACVQLFLAVRDGASVGRIAACDNRSANELGGERVVTFGLFESIDDPAVAQALLDAVAAWGKNRGLTVLRGPANLSSNHEFGLLISGFDQPPALGMPYNPEFYPQLLEQQGLQKAKDLYAWWMGTQPDPPNLERLEAMSRLLSSRTGIRIRNVDPNSWDKEMEIFFTIYNSAWRQNWGYVPITRQEFRYLAHEMRPVIKPEFGFIVEAEGRPVAFSLTVLDANPALRQANGRLFPIGFLKMLWHFRRLDSVRLMILGIEKEYRRKGIDALLYLATLRAARAKNFRGGELGWTLEDNHLINRTIAAAGGHRTKIYRVYERPV